MRVTVLHYAIAVITPQLYLQIGIRRWGAGRHWPFGHLKGQGDLRTLNTWFAGPVYLGLVQ